MTTAKPQNLSLYFDAASAQEMGLPPVYRNTVGYAVLATHVSMNNKANDTNIPSPARLSGQAAFNAGGKDDHVLAAHGALTPAGESYCRVHGIEPSHPALVAYTIHTSQPSIYKGYTPTARKLEAV